MNSKQNQIYLISSDHHKIYGTEKVITFLHIKENMLYNSADIIVTVKRVVLISITCVCMCFTRHSFRLTVNETPLYIIILTTIRWTLGSYFWGQYVVAEKSQCFFFYQ